MRLSIQKIKTIHSTNLSSLSLVWTNDDDCKLVQLVKSTSKPNDKVSFKTRLKQLDWNKIAFKSYSAKDCEERFQNHLNHIRRHRNMHEIVSDIETNVQKCQLKKPLNSYQLFIQEQFPDVKSDGNFVSSVKNSIFFSFF